MTGENREVLGNIQNLMCMKIKIKIMGLIQVLHHHVDFSISLVRLSVIFVKNFKLILKGQLKYSNQKEPN